MFARWWWLVPGFLCLMAGCRKNDTDAPSPTYRALRAYYCENVRLEMGTATSRLDALRKIVDQVRAKDDATDDDIALTKRTLALEWAELAGRLAACDRLADAIQRSPEYEWNSKTPVPSLQSADLRSFLLSERVPFFEGDLDHASGQLSQIRARVLPALEKASNRCAECGIDE